MMKNHAVCALFILLLGCLLLDLWMRAKRDVWDGEEEFATFFSPLAKLHALDGGRREEKLSIMHVVPFTAENCAEYNLCTLLDM